jgi:hypothetical protein
VGDFEERMQIHCGRQLDSIGTAYGVVREFAESDEAYRARIAAEVDKTKQPAEPPPKTAQQIMDERIAESAIDRIDRMFKRGRVL